jgi:hypothetical protein
LSLKFVDADDMELRNHDDGESLEPPWTRHVDRRGYCYYYNELTEASTWERPPAAAGQPASRASRASGCQLPPAHPRPSRAAPVAFQPGCPQGARPSRAVPVAPPGQALPPPSLPLGELRRATTGPPARLGEMLPTPARDVLVEYLGGTVAALEELLAAQHRARRAVASSRSVTWDPTELLAPSTPREPPPLATAARDHGAHAQLRRDQLRRTEAVARIAADVLEEEAARIAADVLEEEELLDR